ncbi:MAG: NAD(P)/FAD-dependent oxidoreductase [Saprospiraceae bacterium]|nr:NAD(P)/FAD-dependent oxidoreductase [Saprospiraceae bacterium]MBK9721196.1 NAD(P)/FAD-dependent oxidoreductase [Saprospiraceae bacterium]
MPFNIPTSTKPRLVIIGAGFAGFTLAHNLKSQDFQIVLLDKNNYHQFQPLFYQVAMSGLEPSSICFPLRKNFQNQDALYVRVAEVQRIDTIQKKIESNVGFLNYDFLVLAMGAETNYYGNPNFEKYSIPLKSVSEALYLRNSILDDLEKAVTTLHLEEQEHLLNIIIVGGGPTGVELAGALAEMKRHILPKDYPDLNSQKMEIHVIQASDRLLDTMSKKSSLKAYQNLIKMGVQIHLNEKVLDVFENKVSLSSGMQLIANKIIWAAGVKGVPIFGLPESSKAPGSKIKVNSFCEVEGVDGIYAIGDLAYHVDEKFPKGLPGLAPVALQQARYLAKQLIAQQHAESKSPFIYIDKGSMATIGRNKAVIDFKNIFLSGFIAWIGWLFIHIYYLIGVRNKIIVFINWTWNYIFYDQALRLNIKPKTTNVFKDI